jgi:hypothetical protein
VDFEREREWCERLMSEVLKTTADLADRHQHRRWQVLSRHAGRVREFETNLRRERQLEIAKALNIGRASVYRVLEAG